MFSRSGVLKIEPIIREKIAMVDEKIGRLRDKGEINVYQAMRWADLSRVSLFVETDCSLSSGRQGSYDRNHLAVRFRSLRRPY